LSYARALRCRKCGREHPLQPINLCEFCLSPLEVTYDYQAMSQELTREKISLRSPEHVALSRFAAGGEPGG
jgi:threonine synthase